MVEFSKLWKYSLQYAQKTRNGKVSQFGGVHEFVAGLRRGLWINRQTAMYLCFPFGHWDFGDVHAA
jgi:hypothetical protein